AGGPAELDGQRGASRRGRTVAGAAPARDAGARRLLGVRLGDRRGAARRRWLGVRAGIPGDGADRAAARGSAGAAMSALGAVLGLVAPAGLLLAAAWSPLLRRVTLDQRLAPYLGGRPRRQSPFAVAVVRAAHG